jgi:hypothetical protein
VGEGYQGDLEELVGVISGGGECGVHLMVLLPGKVWVQDQSILTRHLAGGWVVAEVAEMDGLVVVVHSECPNEVESWETVAWQRDVLVVAGRASYS